MPINLFRFHKQLTNKQSGTALITVILIAAVMVVLVTESVKSLRFQKQLSSNLINRDQAYSYLMGMEELAKVLLKRAFDNSTGNVVNLAQPWAKEDIIFPIDGGTMKASVKDMQGCFNLNSIALLTNNQNTNNQTTNNQSLNNQASGTGAAFETQGQKVFEELISQVSQGKQNNQGNVSANALAAAIRDWIDDDIYIAGPDGAEDDNYFSLEVPYRTANSLIAHTSELRAIRDFNQDIYYELLPHICVLPDKNINQINVNTIDEESAVLIYAILGSRNIQLSNVKSAISNRGDNGYQDVAEFLDEFSVNSKQIKNQGLLSVTSNYFQVDSIAEIGNTNVAMKTLFERDQSNNFKVVSRYFGKE